MHKCKCKRTKQRERMQLVEVVLFFIYLHAAASEYAMHCEERNRQWAEHRGDPVKHCEIEHTAMEGQQRAALTSSPSQHGNLKLGATERLQAWCKADLVFVHAWTLHTDNLTVSPVKQHTSHPPHACLHHRRLIEELSLKSRSIGFRNKVCWLLWERILERSTMTSLAQKCKFLSMFVHPSHRVLNLFMFLSFMKQKRRY